jgi:hypothetical protein
MLDRPFHHLLCALVDLRRLGFLIGTEEGDALGIAKGLQRHDSLNRKSDALSFHAHDRFL